ncbi:MAG: formylglycine-generating enzyme family protein [Alphaproteobacteria bacterium]|nr:formylglycine-generating enzyme family protein [Alphaproteobacteria bacterium]
MVLLHLYIAVAVAQVPTDLVAIRGGAYRPLYPADPEVPVVTVGPFRLESRPVTVGQYRAFVQAHPAWAPGKVPAVRADESYLSRWSSGATLADEQPVTEVSWFAARAYCAALGRRLPTEDEWELVARASTDAFDASADEAWLAEILAWYGRPSTDTLSWVGRGTPNRWGVHDMHGLVWEWVEDFNNTLVSADIREAGDDERSRFCGVGAVSAQDVKDYANFMRVAWRSALEGRTTTRNLGFRCAADEEGP